jgi:hypothetical protein
MNNLIETMSMKISKGEVLYALLQECVRDCYSIWRRGVRVEGIEQLDDHAQFMTALKYQPDGATSYLELETAKNPDKVEGLLYHSNDGDTNVFKIDDNRELSIVEDDEFLRKGEYFKNILVIQEEM